MEKFLKFLGYYWIAIILFLSSLWAEGSESDKLFIISVLFYIIGLIEQSKDELLEVINNNKKES